MHRRPGAADPLRPRMLVMAVGIAALGALQYAWNLRGLWTELEPPATLAEALAKFWFDVTKQDWRETLVNTVSETGLQYRPAMYWFDLRQQVGVPGVALAAIGFCYVLWRWPKRARLPSAVLCGQPGVRLDVQRRRRLYLFSAVALRCRAVRRCGHCGCWRARLARVESHDWRGRERHCCCSIPRGAGTTRCRRSIGVGIDRAERVAGRIHRTTPSAVYGVDTNWQVQNAFEYFMRERRPGVPWFYTEELEWLQGIDRAARFNAFVDSQRGDRPSRDPQWTGRRESHGPASVTAARRRRPLALNFSTRVESASTGHAIRPRGAASRPGVFAQHGAARMMRGAGSHQG